MEQSLNTGRKIAHASTFEAVYSYLDAEYITEISYELLKKMQNKNLFSERSTEYSISGYDIATVIMWQIETKGQDSHPIDRTTFREYRKKLFEQRGE